MSAAGYELPVSFQPAGALTTRLLEVFDPTDTAWSPPRGATTPVVTRIARDGWFCTGRTETTERRRAA